MKKIAVLHGGGPAPGSGTVFKGVVERGTEREVEIIGIPFGFRDLRQGDGTRFRKLLPADVSDQHECGGTFLPTDRASLLKKDKASEYLRNTLQVLQQHGISGLVAIGGEDTGSSAAALSRHCASIPAEFGVMHCAKTIDCDVWHPMSLPTFGAHTAAQVAALDLIGCKGELIANPERIFLVGIMGRSSGELARQAALAGGASRAAPDLVLVPELFPSKVPLEAVRNMITLTAIRTFKEQGRGPLILMSEGVVERCTEDSILHLIQGISKDEHGHPALGQIDFPSEVARLLREYHERIEFRDTSKKPFSVSSLNIGYGRLRCAAPSRADVEHTLAIGRAAVDALLNGSPGASIFYCGNGECDFLPFEESVDPSDGRMRTRPMSLHEYKKVLENGSPLPCSADARDATIVCRTGLDRNEFRVRFASAIAAAEIATEAIEEAK